MVFVCWCEKIIFFKLKSFNEIVNKIMIFVFFWYDVNDVVLKYKMRFENVWFM